MTGGFLEDDYSKNIEEIPIEEFEEEMPDFYDEFMEKFYPEILKKRSKKNGG